MDLLLRRGGVITVRQARGKITAGVEEERKKRVRASEREEKRDANARIKWNQAIAKGFKLTSSGVDQQLGRCFRCRIRGWGLPSSYAHDQRSLATDPRILDRTSSFARCPSASAVQIPWHIFKALPVGGRGGGSGEKDPGIVDERYH